MYTLHTKTSTRHVQMSSNILDLQRIASNMGLSSYTIELKREVVYQVKGGL